MGLFNLTDTTGLKDTSNYLKAGIHKAKFVSITPGTITSQKDGRVYNVMTLTVNIEGHGDWNHNFFEPDSNERTQGAFGLNPSKVDHFMVSLRQIFDALDPAIGEAIDNNKVMVNGKVYPIDNLDFDKLVKLAAYLTKDLSGKDVEIKLIPTSTGFNDLPGFPARINRAGLVGVATRFIGHDLTLSQSEQKKIDAALNARPTQMQSAADSTLSGVADALGIDTTADLPF